jgi:hypothetical protein
LNLALQSRICTVRSPNSRQKVEFAACRARRPHGAALVDDA